MPLTIMPQGIEAIFKGGGAKDTTKEFLEELGILPEQK